MIQDAPITDDELKLIMDEYKSKPSDLPVTQLTSTKLVTASEREYIRNDEREYLRQLEEQARIARIPLDSYLNHLVRVYNLSQTDTLELETGKIVRVEAKAE